MAAPTSRTSQKSTSAAQSVDPLRLDPSRTLGLRKSFMASLTTRFNIVKRRLVELIETEDAFGIRSKQKSSPFSLNQRWSFRTTPEQLEEFENWLREQYAGVILDEGNPEAWFEEYIRRGWQQGVGRAFQDARPRLADVEPQFYAGTREQFLRSAFNQPVSKERLKLLAGRTLTELRGVTQASATRMLRELTDGLVRGESPRDVARRLADVLDGDIKRAHTVARTETIRAHAEGQLDSLEILGVSEVGAAVEWSTAHLRVCPLCRPLEGIVLSIQEARGMIPRHPNCRCAWIPANVGESDPKQIRTRRRIESQIRASVEQELPSGKRSAKEVDKRMRNTPWVGADAQISSERPKSILED